MKKHQEILVLFALSVFSLTVLCRIHFDICNFDRRPSEESRLLVFTERSLDHCMEECARRSSCQVVGYHHLARLCELFSDSTATTTILGYMTVGRKDMKMYDNESSLIETVCNENQPNDLCNECRPPKAFQNGIYLGNMNQIGSKRAVVCDKDYAEVSSQRIVECKPDGEWDYVPVCTIVYSDNACNLRPSPSGENGYQVNEHGTWRNMSCAEGTVFHHLLCTCGFPA